MSSFLTLAFLLFFLAKGESDVASAGVKLSQHKQRRRMRHVVEGDFLDDSANAETFSSKIVLSEALNSSTGKWTGHRIWPSTVVLLQHLHRKLNSLQGLRVLELGCGLPFLAACLAALGAEVCATDLPEAMPHAEACFSNDSTGAALEGLTPGARSRLRLRPLTWGGNDVELSKLCGFTAPVDLVIGADIVYHEFPADALYHTLVSAIESTNATAVLALQPRRFPQKSYLNDPKLFKTFVRRLAGHAAGWEVLVDRPGKDVARQLGEGVEDAIVITIRPSAAKIRHVEHARKLLRYSREEL